MNLFQIPAEIKTEHFETPPVDIYYPLVSRIPAATAVNQAIIATEYTLHKQQGYFENPMTEVVGQYETKTNQHMFPISVYQIQDIIDQHGPLGKMAKNN
jgi:hypothetical protein